MAAQTIETLRIFTPLGFRLYDAALDSSVTEGLLVQAWRQDGEFGPVAAIRSPSGVYGFHHLPGLRSVEYSNGAAVSSPPLALPFVVTVEDRLGRFLPTSFGLTLPLSFRGLFPAAPPSPPGASARLFLFSGPQRTVPAGLAVVRADLWDVDAAKPAAHAVVRVEAGGRIHTGIAGARGQALVLFPEPDVESLRTGSPPGIGQVPPQNVHWPVVARVRYQPSHLRFLLGGRANPYADLPTLRSVFEDQGPATIQMSEGGPFQTDLPADLAYGQPLVLQTIFPGPAPNRFRLLVRALP
jgi:hypothetical protein